MADEVKFAIGNIENLKLLYSHDSKNLVTIDLGEIQKVVDENQRLRKMIKEYERDLRSITNICKCGAQHLAQASLHSGAKLAALDGDGK